ncbi:MAG: hypothetical protein GEU81_12200 [Nitriliruptorales bacterium]|nr:hypothetical protein [Nitriliruptorales bacterium]
MSRDGGRTLFLVIWLLSMALLVAACSGAGEVDGAGDDAAAGSGEVETVTYLAPVPPSANYYPPWVAQELGFMEEEGIDFQHEAVGSDVSMTTLLVQGEVDVASPGLAETFQGLQAGQDFDIIYEYSKSAIEYVGVPEDSDIQSVEDLEGTTVGLAENELRSLLELSLQEAGMTSDDVETVQVGTSGPTVAQSFERAAIDVYVGSILDFAALNAAGVPLRDITPERYTNIPATSFAAAPEMLSEQEDLLVRFFRAWSKGYHAGLTNHDVVETVMREVVPEVWEDEEAGNALFEETMETREANQDMDAYGSLRTELWEDAVEQAVQAGDLEAPLDTSEFLNDSLIEGANDFDREAVEQTAQEWLEENS